MSEAKRADLYTGLVEVLGPDRAETLMAHIPRFDPADLATKADLKELRVEFRSELRDGLAAVDQCLDRVCQTLMAGLFVIVAAMIGMALTVA